MEESADAASLFFFFFLCSDALARGERACRLLFHDKKASACIFGRATEYVALEFLRTVHAQPFPRAGAGGSKSEGFSVCVCVCVRLH